jgi:very-long-chain (3R)-3-hydroxyacyl-CoA dehydratase
LQIKSQNTIGIIINIMAEKSSKKPSGSLSLGEFYLVFYNLVLTIGWALILLVTIRTSLSWRNQSEILTSKDLYSNQELLLQIFQTAALLEVVHAMVGLVRSNAMLVLFQVLSRLCVVWAVLFAYDPARHNVGVFVVCCAWPVAEIIRYVYYALNLLNVMPYIVTWCRYSFFIVLYPIGVTGELICIYHAVKHLGPMAVRKQYSLFLPNKMNISFDMQYALIFAMLCYVPIFPMLYNHMRAQRRKILGTSSKGSAKKAN